MGDASATEGSSRTDPRHRLGRRARWAILLVAGAGLLAGSAFVGPVAIPPGTVAGILLHEVSGGALAPHPCGSLPLASPACQGNIEIVWDVRLPALLLAVIAGAALGVSGATLQGVFRNPLADPYLLGLSSGAALGVAALFILRVGVAEANLVLPLLAFVGALGTGAIVLAAARRASRSVETLLLTGVAISNFLSAVMLVLVLANPIGSLQVTFWLLGGLGGATWARDGIAFGGALVAGGILSLYGRELNLLQLGPDVAQSLGLPAARVRSRLLLLASLATAMAVAFTGVIGFVGLVSPHIVRRVLGGDYRVVLPASAFVGGVFLLVANDLALIALPTSELPVGIVTAFAGAPFFLALLYRRRRAAGEAAA